LHTSNADILAPTRPLTQVPDYPAFQSAETCRFEVSKRNLTCHTECDTCKAYCSNNVARNLKDAVVCTFQQPTLGLAVASQISDAGQHILTKHGSKRTSGRPPIPEDAWKEQFALLVNNDVDSPRVPRNSVSCRKNHRESTGGHYRNHLDVNGEPIARTGFMVECQTDSDCKNRCGEHPIHNAPYVCTKNPRLYSTFVVNDSTPDGMYVTAPGDDRFDIQGGVPGVCTDFRMDFAHTGCESRAGSAAVVGLVGCSAKLGWNRAYCGAVLERVGPDFLSVFISEESLNYPRTLVPPGVVGGVPVQLVECNDATECVNKCELMNRRARSGGLPAPEACALCQSLCPSNVGTTVMDAIESLSADISTAVNIARICFGDLGMAGCLCNIVLSMKPNWINNLPAGDERAKCKGSNIFTLIGNKIIQMALRFIDYVVNDEIVDPANAILCWIPFCPQIPRLCLSGPFNEPGPERECKYGSQLNTDALGCYDDGAFNADKQCFFVRRDAICTDKTGTYGEYQGLFDAPTAEELQKKYNSLVGDSFAVLNPAFASLMSKVTRASGYDVAAARDLCDDSYYGSMDLDKIIIVCFFEHVRKFCPSDGSSERFQTFIKNDVVWQLPTVTFDWDASPPPPPPVQMKSELSRLALLDPEGFAIAEDLLDDVFPRLNHVLSKQAGSIIKNKYGPKYYVNKYEATIAYLATEHFENADGLAARMIQARFTGYGRFSCMALKEFMSDPTNAAAGTNSPADAQTNNPSNYNSPYDRNWLIILATVFTRSLMVETGVKNVAVNAMSFWKEQCEEPLSYVTAIEPAKWQRDPRVMDPRDSLGNVVTSSMVSPIVAYGSLRQLRDFESPFSTEYSENPVLFITRITSNGRRTQEEQHGHKRNLLANFFIKQAVKIGLKAVLKNVLLSGDVQPTEEQMDDIGNVYRTNTFHTTDMQEDQSAMQVNYQSEMLRKVFCNPQHPLTVEEVIGDPPPFDSSFDKFDSSSYGNAQDLRAPATFKGSGNYDTQMSQSGASASTTGSLSYRDRSLRQWVYVTSSDDATVLPGWHRLSDLRAFPDLNCNEVSDQSCGYLRQYGVGSSSEWTGFAQVSTVGESLLSTIGNAATRQAVNTAVDYAFKLFGRRLQYFYEPLNYIGHLKSIKVFKINDNVAMPIRTTFRTGVEALLSARCSNYLESSDIPYAQKCSGTSTAWYREYATSNGCSNERLELLPVAEYNVIGSYLNRFTPPRPPPQPPPPPPPTVPPVTPFPKPPPRPPSGNSRAEVAQFASKSMEAFCDSVYILSAESRCNALAIELHTRITLNGFDWNPPNLPPLTPFATPPPPPPSPPGPGLPLAERALLRLVPIYRASLSTMFLPVASITPADPPVAAGGAYPPSEWLGTLPERELRAVKAKLDALHNSTGSAASLVACTDSLITAGAVLPCRSASSPDTCIDGAESCGTFEGNTKAPWVELDFEDYRPDFNGRMYLFAVKFFIPATEELGRQLFHAPERYGQNAQENRGWTLTAYDETHSKLPVQCQDWNVGANVVEYAEGLKHVSHVCLPATAADEAYDTLSRTRFLRVTLVGNYRQIWLDNIQVTFRAITDINPRPPPPPPSPKRLNTPIAPDAPSRPPQAHACSTFDNLVYDSWNGYVVALEPCGFTQAECCDAVHDAVERGIAANAFVISATGCCSILDVPHGVVTTTPTRSFQFGVAGTGLVHSS